MDRKTIGQQFTPILEEIESALWEFEYAMPNSRPVYDGTALRSASKIFMSALMDKMWAKQDEYDMPQKQRCEMATYFGNALHELIRDATDLNSKKFYE